MSGRPGARPEVAFVVQRYGEGITGGSESLARAVAERLAGEHRITVFTTCARDYVTWRNELPEGPERLGGVDVLRFPVEEERDLAAFNAFAEPLYARERTHDEEIEFLRRQGPHAPRLVEALRAQKDRFAAVVFFTYLYSPTYWGLEAAPERAALVPTTHDEPPLRFGIYREVFARPRAFGFLTPAEEALVRRRFDVGERPCVLAGMGVDVPERPDVAGFRARHALARPYALYAGRIDAGKGCAEMLAFHERYRRERPGGADLVLIGKLAMPEPRGEGVRYLGLPAGGGEGRGHGGRAGGRLPERLREPLDRAARGLRPRDARASSTRARPCWRSTACARTRASSTPTATSTSRRWTASRARSGCARRSARTAGATWRRSTAGTWCSSAGGRC